MINSFDTEIALDVGINAAILYKNIQYWCEFNKTNDKNFHDGYYWTYNSTKAFSQQFKYLSAKQVRTALDVLEEKGYIKVGNFNQLGGDRTKWYTDLKAENKAFAPEGKSNLLRGQMELPCKANGTAPEGEAIPNINTDIESDINTIPPIISPEENRKLLFKQFWEAYPSCDRKVDKDGCERKFIKIKDLEKIFPDIMASLESWKRKWIKDNNKYVPLTSKWINQKYWTVIDTKTEVQTKFDEAADEHFRDFFPGG